MRLLDKSKTRKLLEQVVVKAEQLERERNEAIHIANTQRILIADLSARLSSLQDEVHRGHAHLEDAMAIIHEQDARQHAKQDFAPVRRPSDEEQELRWQLDHHLIKPDEYEHMLKQLEFDNAEIQLDPDYSPRPDLTY